MKEQFPSKWCMVVEFNAHSEEARDYTIGNIIASNEARQGVTNFSSTFFQLGEEECLSEMVDAYLEANPVIN